MIYDDLLRELESQQHRDGEMSIQTERLLLDAAETIRLLRQSWDNKCHEVVDLTAELAKANERVAEMQYEAGMYQALYENSAAQLASARKALDTLASWRYVDISAEYENGLRGVIRSMIDCAVNARDSFSDENSK